MEGRMSTYVDVSFEWGRDVSPSAGILFNKNENKENKVQILVT